MMDLVGYQNPLYESSPQQRPASAGFARASYAGDSPKSRGTGHSAASVRSCSPAPGSGSPHAGTQPALEVQPVSPPSFTSLGQATSMSCSSASPTQRSKKNTLWQKLTRGRSHEKRGWAKLLGLKFCTKSAIQVLESGDYSETVTRIGSRGSLEDSKHDDSDSLPSTPHSQAPSHGAAEERIVVAERPPAALRWAADIPAAASADCAEKGLETQGEKTQSTNGLGVKSVPAVNDVKEQVAEKQSASALRTPRVMRASKSEYHLPQPALALEKEVKSAAQPSSKRKSSRDICHTPKQSPCRTPRSRVRAEAASEKLPSKTQDSRQGSRAAKRLPYYETPGPYTEEIAERAVLSSRASVTELLEDWRASHPHPPHGEKPFIDPNEYGGHVNVNRLSWRPSGSSEGSESTTITSVLHSKVGSHLVSHRHTKVKRRSHKNIPNRDPQPLAALPVGLEPLNVPTEARGDQRIPPQPTNPRHWGEENFAEAIGIKRVDKCTGLAVPKCDEWIQEAQPPQQRFIPLDQALRLEDMCALSEGGASTMCTELLAETISEAKVASFLASLPTLTLESGSVFLTATEKHGELRCVA